MGQFKQFYFFSVLKTFFIFCAALSISSCVAHKGTHIDAQEHTSEQDILDIVNISSSRFEKVLGKKLNTTPKISFVTAQQLKLHLLSDDTGKTKSASKSLIHYTQSVVAIYDDEDKGIYVVPENIKIYKKINHLSSDAAYYSLLNILTHELVHALQDQEGLLSYQSNSEQETLAFSTLVEGHTDMQTALVLKQLGIVRDIYDYGTHRVVPDSDDEELNKFSEQFSQKYVTGKKIFNRIHKKFGNQQTWMTLKNPTAELNKILNK